MITNFFLDKNIVFLNHGSFGACPKEVIKKYQYWQIELEKQPVEFLVRKSTQLLEFSRKKLADFLHTKTDNLVYITNTTYGVNSVIESLKLTENDEVITSNHEYGACNRAWEFASKQNGFLYKKVDIPLENLTNDLIINLVFEQVTTKTKVIFLSHITSSTALIFPIKEICKKAKELNILTVIDGAHAPGQIDLNLDETNADIYIGNCHKWMLAPKGSAFIYVKPELQKIIRPQITSWGQLWENGAKSEFIAEFEMQGTRDISSFLTVPTAIEFLEKNDWFLLNSKSKNIIEFLNQELSKLLQTKSITNDLSMFGQMYAHQLPQNIDTIELKKVLYDKYKIEIPITRIENNYFIRPSCQAYNTKKDFEYLIESLKEIFIK